MVAIFIVAFFESGRGEIGSDLCMREKVRRWESEKVGK